MVKKPMKVESTPRKRSVLFTWKYDPDPEDTGFSFTVVGGPPRKTLNITARKYQVHHLGNVRLIFDEGPWLETPRSLFSLTGCRDSRP